MKSLLFFLASASMLIPGCESRSSENVIGGSCQYGDEVRQLHP
jgi:hypothetical protein